MSREEAIDLLDNLIGMVDDNHDSDYDTALKMAVKALEAWDDLLQWLDMIKPKTYPRTKGWIECIKQIYKEHMKGDFYQPPLTNQQMLATISAAEFLAKINWLFHDYGKRYADSNLAIMEWLDSEVEDEQTKR